MLTADGCRARRRRFLDELKPTSAVVLADPLHLRYLANFHVDGISLGADFGGVLVLQPDGHATLHHDNRLPKSVEATHVDERIAVPWYDGQSPGRGPRGLVLRPAIEAAGGRVHDAITDPLAPRVFDPIAELRRRKDPDEIDVLKACMRVTEAGHAWARANVKPGMTELEAYSGIAAACYAALGHWAIVYGDFVVVNGKQRSGPPSPHALQPGEMFIADYSVIIQGYRSDFTNTLVIGRQPTAEQTRLYELCVAAMRAGEGELKAGAKCQAVYDAVRGVFVAAGVADLFTHHAGHGLGVAHPEPPYFVRHSTETLVAGDVVTLEPGLYAGDNGIRIENNYLVTDTGFETLSRHTIALT